jgi:hypothetical protein
MLGFAEVHDANVLIYFPHGVGDWAQFAYLLPTLEPSNRYWMTCYGDDFVSLIEDCQFVKAAYVGVNSIHNDSGGLFGNRDFRMDFNSLDGSPREVRLPIALWELCRSKAIQAILWVMFPETYGGAAYPFHSKARNAMRFLVAPERLSECDLSKPLVNSLSFAGESFVRRWVEARLQSLIDLRNRRICLIARNGYSSTHKNWGNDFRQDMPRERRREGEECRDFIRLLQRCDRRWLFLLMEERLFEGYDTVRSSELDAYSYAEFFGSLGEVPLPFGLVMRALAARADLCVGVPTGPFHVCMARAELPTVGIWIHHLPSWYEEPRAGSIHIVGRHVGCRIDGQPGSFSTKGGLHFNVTRVGTRAITGEQVLAVVETLVS